MRCSTLVKMAAIASAVSDVRLCFFAATWFASSKGVFQQKNGRAACYGTFAIELEELPYCV